MTKKAPASYLILYQAKTAVCFLSRNLPSKWEKLLWWKKTRAAFSVLPSFLFQNLNEGPSTLADVSDWIISLSFFFFPSWFQPCREREGGQLYAAIWRNPKRQYSWGGCSQGGGAEQWGRAGRSQAASSKAVHTGPVLRGQGSFCPTHQNSWSDWYGTFPAGIPGMHCPQVPPLCQGPRFGLANTDFTLNISSDVASVISWPVEANDARGAVFAWRRHSIGSALCSHYSVSGALQPNNAREKRACVTTSRREATTSNGSEAPY